MTVHGVCVVQAVLPPVTLAVLTAGVATVFATATRARITGAAAAGSNTSVVVHVRSVPLVTEHAYMLFGSMAVIVMPAGMRSVTVIAPLVLLVPLLRTFSE